MTLRTRLRAVDNASGVTQMVADLTKALRTQQGLSPDQLGKRIGYTGAAISAVET